MSDRAPDTALVMTASSRAAALNRTLAQRNALVAPKTLVPHLDES